MKHGVFLIQYFLFKLYFDVTIAIKPETIANIWKYITELLKATTSQPPYTKVS